MNKISLMSLSLSLILASPIAFSSSYKKAENFNIEKQINNQLINWNDVEINLNQMFENITFEKNSKELGTRNQEQFETVIKFIRQNNNKNINKFKSDNYDLKLLQKYLCETNDQYKSVYQNPTQFLKENNLNFENAAEKINSIKVFSDTNNLEWLKNHVNKLKVYKVTFATLSATAAVAAAGFWAAAWWFGISIPWAVGATLASTLTGAAASGITIALVKYDQEMDRLVKAGSIFGATFSLGHIFYSILNPIFVGLSASATAVSWAFPAVLAVVGIAVAVLAWISLYK